MEHKLSSSLRADCASCFGLCCIALYFSVHEGFPLNKKVGEPCPNLLPDFRCSEHDSLKEQGYKGCLTYDCFGAGQKVSQVSFGGRDWREVPESSGPMFRVFLVVLQLHELLWYLAEALTLEPARSIYSELKSMLGKTEELIYLEPAALLNLDVAAHRAQVTTLILKTGDLVRDETRRRYETGLRKQKTFKRGADLAGADLKKADLKGVSLRGACLIAADLRGSDLSGTNFIGADLRDADIRGADLSKSIFLTQAQINAAKGDAGTRVPPLLNHPAHWEQ